MNKYEKAFDVIDTILHLMCGEKREDRYEPSHAEFSSAMKDFKELVEKVKPKKVVYKRGSDGERWFFCPRCNEIVPRTSNFNQHTYPYCPYCGGKFDWSEYFDVD